MIRGGVRRICSQPAKLPALLGVLLGTLGVSVSLDTNSTSMPHMCKIRFDTQETRCKDWTRLEPPQSKQKSQGPSE